MSIEGQYQTVI